MEPKEKTPKIIELMGKENKKQRRKTHKAITEVFRSGGKRNESNPDKET